MSRTLDVNANVLATDVTHHHRREPACHNEEETCFQSPVTHHTGGYAVILGTPLALD